MLVLRPKFFYISFALAAKPFNSDILSSVIEELQYPIQLHIKGQTFTICCVIGWPSSQQYKRLLLWHQVVRFADHSTLTLVGAESIQKSL